MKQHRARPVTLSGVVVAIAVLASLVAAACGGSTATEVERAVSIVNGELVPDTIHVTVDDKVVLIAQSDESGLLRVGGYEVKGQLVPGQVTELRFTAFERRSTGNSMDAGVPIYFKSDTEREIQVGLIDVAFKGKLGRGTGFK